LAIEPDLSFIQRMSSVEAGQSGPWHGTTILTVRKGGLVAIGGDGQVSIGQTIIKRTQRKYAVSAAAR